MAAILMHLMRVFFTGAFRKPRELTWIVGLVLLFTALLEGYMGYSLVDDLLSGMGLAIGYGVGLSIPVIGGPAMLAIFGAPFPGRARISSRVCTSPTCCSSRRYLRRSSPCTWCW